MYPNPLNVTLRNIKTFNGREGQGFSATMYVDGKLTAEVLDDANGGCYSVHVVYDRKAKAPVEGAAARLKQVEEFIKTLPETPWPASFGKGPNGSTGYQPGIDEYLSEMVEAASNEKRLARLRKTNTLIKVDADKPGEFRTMKCLDLERVKAYCDKTFGVGKWSVM